MQPSVHMILLVLAFVLVLVESFGVNPPRCNLGWLGLAFFVLSFLFVG